MATASTPELPEDDDDRRKERVNEVLGEWLERRFDTNPDFRFGGDDAVEATGLPEEDVRQCLNRLVDDDVTPLKRELGEYFLDE